MNPSPPLPRTTRSCGITCVSTTTSAFVRWRKQGLREKVDPSCKPARQRSAGWRQGDQHLFIYFILELERYAQAAEADATGSTSNVVHLFVERSRRRLDFI